jgi:IPT/TIG domain/FG-GAP repeat
MRDYGGLRDIRPVGLLGGDGNERPLTRQAALPWGVALPWRAVMVAGLLSVLVGVALAWGLVSGHSSSSSSSSSASPAVARGGLSSLPVAARGPVSAALGSADPRYRVRASKGGFEAVNPAQRLQVRFGRSGVRIGSGAVGLGLSLDGVGYGRSLEPAGDVLSHAEGNRVVYAGDGLSEWYANGPLGLEQGFTVSRAPTGRPSSGPLTLSMALSGNVRAALAPGWGSVILSRGGSSVRYGDLAVSDARGHMVRSWLVLRSGRILLHVDTQGARYPLRIDPTFAQQAELTGGPEEQGKGLLGTSVAISADGDTALVGAPNDEEGVGAAWVFTRSGSKWSEQAKLTGGEASGGGATAESCEEEEEEEEAGACGFGGSVALSADGDTALVGDAGADGSAGAAWVFTRGEESWARRAKLIGGEEERSKGHFGRSVALSGNGDTALIGAPGEAVYHGVAWVFARSGTSWSEYEREGLTPAGESGLIHFGRSVALSANGETTLIGAPGAVGRTGAAWVFTGSGTKWTEQAKLTATEGSDEAHVGFSVALSGDGATALLGGLAEEGNPGAAWVFTREGTSWSEPDKLTAAGGGDGEAAKFGYSVALSADGATALVGSPKCSAHVVCAAWVFTRSGSTSTFNFDETLTAAGGGRFGASVALSADGETALLGAPGNEKRSGAAWAFGPSGPPPVVMGVSPTEGPTEGGTTVTISGSNFTDAETMVDFGKVPAKSFEVNSEGTITAESPKHEAGTVHVTVDDVAGKSTESESDQFTFVAPKKGGGKEPEPEPKPGPGGTGNNGASGTNGGTGKGAVLAFGPTTGAGGCGVALLGRSIAVRKHGHARLAASLKLIWAGKRSAAVCRGKLTLQVKVKRKAKAKGRKKKRLTAKTIGTAGFAIAAGKTEVVAIALNPAGRALLAAGHGRLSASLVILRLSPGPAHAQSARVRLALQRKKRRRP